MPTEQELVAQLTSMGDELDKRAKNAERLDNYFDGKHPVPAAVTQTRTTRAYERMLELSNTNWPQLIVDSVAERLEVQAIRVGDDQLDGLVWEAWQANAMDADSSLTHKAALTTARAYVVVWPGMDGRLPEIVPEHSSKCIVRYAPGSRRRRAAALLRWTEGDDKWHATLYRPEGVYKFHKVEKPAGEPGQAEWMRRDVPGEPWPLPNPFGTMVPVVELAVNRKLDPSPYGCAFGEFERNLGHIDRINFATFSQIVAMTWSGFPLRALIGDPIAYDDDGAPIAPFDIRADSLVQIENPDGKLTQLPEANLENYGKAVDRYVEQLAALTKTPAHYLLGQMVNLSADAIRAAEAGLISKIRGHQRALGEAWEEVARLSLTAMGVDLTGTSAAQAEVVWADPESRSLAERADAAVKLKDILPWQALAAKIVGASPQEIMEWEMQRASESLLAPPPALPVPDPA